MKALKYQVQISSDHRVVVEVPEDTPEGPAEVIVLVQEQAGAQRTLQAVLADFRSRAGGRSKEEIDAAMAAERAGWAE